MKKLIIISAVILITTIISSADSFGYSYSLIGRDTESFKSVTINFLPRAFVYFEVVAYRMHNHPETTFAVMASCNCSQAGPNPDPELHGNNRAVTFFRGQIYNGFYTGDAINLAYLTVTTTFIGDYAKSRVYW